LTDAIGYQAAWSLPSALQYGFSTIIARANMKSFWIGGALGFILGVGLTFLYFSLATLFSVHSKLAVEAAQTPRVNDSDILPDEAQSEKAKTVGA
jgi:hypothetical protein